jgi:DNA polymerase elongation subunit (family B)
MSILDYLGWFKKVTLNKAKSYALNSVGEEYLGKGKTYKKVDFSQVTDELVLRNREDVDMMAQLEEKFNIVPYFDEIRRLSKVEWEDLLWNSRIIDMLLLKEAKEQKIALPMKSNDNVEGTYEGAYREAYELGAQWNIGKYDLTSAYPNMVVDFCLDPSNIVTAENHNKVEIEGTAFHQNAGAVLPTVVKKLMKLKDEIKKELKAVEMDSPEMKAIEIKYNAIKSVVNSSYGVMGNRFFRLYDPRVASATTFLVRDLLHHVKDRLDEQGYNVIYVDTDSVFIKHEGNLTELLNDLILEWAEKYEKPEISTKFDYEGHFEKLLILAKCRYIGYVNTGHGIKEEIKGVEMKRKDSTEFMKKFQKEIVHKILDKSDKVDIYNYIKTGIANLKNAPLKEIAFPCKISKKLENYKNLPIFVRAVQETEGFEPKLGDEFFYTYVEPEKYVVEKEVVDHYILEPGKREGSMRKKNLTNKLLLELQGNPDVEIHSDIKLKKIAKYRDVKAFDEYFDTSDFQVDWMKMVDRNIWNKLDVIFTAMGWDINEARDYVR